MQHIQTNPNRRIYSLPFSKQQILDCSKLKDFADDNFKFDENVPQCFQKTCTADTGLFGKGLKRLQNIVRKGDKADYQHFPPFSLHLTGNFPSDLFKVRIAGKKDKCRFSLPLELLEVIIILIPPFTW